MSAGKTTMQRIGAPAKQRGITIVEVLVALTAGLALSAGLIQFFASNKQSYRLQEAQSRVQENARYAIEMLQRDIRAAGYRGCAAAANVVNTLVNPTAYNFNFAQPVQGFEWTTGTTWSPALDSAITAGSVDPEAGTDVITVRGPIGTSVKVETPYMNNVSAALQVTAGNNFEQCDIVMVSDCQVASIMQITGANPGTSGTLTHNTGGACAAAGDPGPGNATTNLGKTYTSDAEIIAFGTRTYWVGTSTATGRRALYRKTGTAAAEELVEGVENMQILYGEDTDQDGSPNRYLKASVVADWTRVMTARISLLFASTDDAALPAAQSYTYNGSTVTPTDRALRRVFNITVGIRNRLP